MYSPRMVSTKPCGMTSCNSAVLIIITNVLIIPSLVRSENVALNKPAFQSGQVGLYRAARAVDGDYSLASVAIPDARQVNYTDNAVWWVDLQDTYRVTSIKTYGPFGRGKPDTVRYFVLSVGPDLTQLSDCSGEYEEPSLPVTIPCDKTGQIVHFRRTGRGHLPYETALREVEVTGISQIRCDLCLSSCNGDTGCEQCPAGKQQPDCVQDCTKGRYGVNCANQCGRCADVSGCHVVNGTCPGVCQTWWATDTCDIKIAMPIRTSENIVPVESTNSSLQVRWQQIASVPRDLERFYGYVVSSKKNEEQAYTENTRVPQVGAGYNFAVIERLEYSTHYAIKVVPYKEHFGIESMGVPYPILAMTTLCGHPDPPTGLTAFKVPDKYIIRVSWKDVRSPAILSRCESILGLRVEYRMSDITEWKQESVAISTYTTDLAIPERKALYQVRVISINNVNFESSSEDETVTVEVCTNTILIVAVLVTAVAVAAISVSVTYLVTRGRRTGESRNTNNVHLDTLPFENVLPKVDHTRAPVPTATLGDMTPTNDVKADVEYEALDPQVPLPEPSVYDEIRAAPPARG